MASQKVDVELTSKEVDAWLSALSTLQREETVELNRLNSELQQLAGSISWRITAPVRKARRLAKKILRK